MRFSVQLPTDRVERGDEYTGADAIAEMAEAIEGAGFDACWVTEHPFPSDEWMASGGHHSLDPFVAVLVCSETVFTSFLYVFLFFSCGVFGRVITGPPDQGRPNA